MGVNGAQKHNVLLLLDTRVVDEIQFNKILYLYTASEREREGARKKKMNENERKEVSTIKVVKQQKIIQGTRYYKLTPYAVNGSLHLRWLHGMSAKLNVSQKKDAPIIR